MPIKELIYPSRRFHGKPMIPGDKSISHRGLILGAMAQGCTELVNLLESADVHSTIHCLQQLGVRISQLQNRTFIEGVGPSGLIQPHSILDCGNSGTTMRLLMGLLAGQDIQATLTGDHSLRHRPMKRVADPLSHMGAHITLTEKEHAPLTIQGGFLRPIEYPLHVASAQVKTAIILAALSTKGITQLTGRIDSRDHTERMLCDFGIHLNVSAHRIQIPGPQTLQATTLQVPGDPSTAAFWIAAACLIPESQLQLDAISLNPTRLGFVRVLQRMGAEIQIETTSRQLEPVGKIRVTARPLRGVRVLKEEVPSLIDEIPLLAIIGSQADGVFEIEGAEELRLKESDRLAAIATNLRAMGASIDLKPDGFRIVGIQKLQGAVIQSHQDHRIAMAFSIAALIAQGPTEILDADCTKVSYPRFFPTLKECTQ